MNLSGIFRSLLAFLLLAALLVVAVPPERSFACSCVGFTTLEAKEHADSVFRGTVTKIEKPSKLGNSASLAKVYLQVDEVWKGSEQREIMVSSALAEASCGVSFQEGKSYLVFAKSYDDLLKTTICNGTKQLSLANQELKDLGPGQKELAQIELEKQSEQKTSQTDSDVDLYTPLWIALGVTALVGAALWLFGRSRRV